MRRAVSRYTRNIMAVPRMTELRPGVGVNIVLKADQRSGKLTKGRIADILTRGDHPRGIKVRLADGQIGRVQSLSTLNSTDPEPATAATITSQSDEAQGRFGNNRSRRGGRGMQEDYRLDPTPAETSSLLDYVKPPRRRKENVAIPKVDEAAETRELLEKEFPNIDPALIAAIFMDHDGKLSAMRNTLSTLSGD